MTTHADSKPVAEPGDGPADEAGFWSGRPTLVTGASGLLGGWLVERLLDLGARVTCLVRGPVDSSRLATEGLLPRLTVVRGDVRDRARLERVLGESRIDTVMHLAAQAIVGEANREPCSTLEVNVEGTWGLLEACRRSDRVRQIVLASSDKAYGDTEVLPLRETTPLCGRHPYDVSKSCADLIAQTYAHTYDLPVVITRCGNFYGGGDLNWNRIVPGTIRAIARGERPELRSDGRSIRDYLYIEDAAAAYTLLAARLAADRTLAGEAFNFSIERPVTALQLVRLVLAEMGSDLEPLVCGGATGEIRHQHLSAEKARERLGWRGRFSLEQGLRRTIAWYRASFASERGAGAIGRCTPVAIGNGPGRMGKVPGGVSPLFAARPESRAASAPNVSRRD